MEIKRLVVPPLDNNIYLVVSDAEALIIDAGGDTESAARIKAELGTAKAKTILVTHGHFDHVQGANDIKEELGDIPVYLHPQDVFLWQRQHPNTRPDHELTDGMEFKVGKAVLNALHTPGHTPGSTCFYLASEKVVFTGDTLFPGGPGATRWDYSDFELIIKNIESRLLTLALDTKILPGHGGATTIGAEASNLESWKARHW